MEDFYVAFGPGGVLGTVAAMVLGGFAKGVVGFALPLIAVSIMASFLPAKVAVALMVVPILVSNLLQALRGGMAEAWASLVKYRRLNLVFFVTIVFAARLVVLMPDAMLYGVLGATITGFGAAQVLGWRPTFAPRRARLAEILAGIAAGIFGGIAGIWGPPLVIYLLAAEVPKIEMVRVQSITFALGAIVLLVSHAQSGVLDAMTLPMSTWLTLPTLAGMFLGYGVQDRLDQELFRKVTLIVLIAAGLNLLRRAIGA
ncbi:sulfite exporter TauE/SafE family protein [uncultured Amaricoccus sp.]|uniref:sulfite exporter TauE/SafE family protein n=1 Tax=uncultured Amaricoccus sp. TaxID=339341 RepID=UPI0026148BC7|nr:sulfite exporter TauE/SafE family protein [uncultured Amaricoccus sp.]